MFNRDTEDTPMLQTAVPVMTSVAFPALGTEALIVSPAAARLDDLLRREIARYERCFSRFLPDSELERLVARAGRPVVVSGDLFHVLQRAVRFWRDTGGIFDPFIRPDLEAAGYDRTFSALSFQPTSPLPPGSGRPSFARVQLNPATRRVRLPKGARLDLGGIAKSWIVDRIAELLSPYGPLLVDIGGDIVAREAGPDGGPGWLIGVAHPRRQHDDLSWFRLRDAAVATSTTMRRRWRREGETLHHLIDPRTGRPAAAGLLQVTVVAPSALEADVYAKTALILGAVEGLAWLVARRLSALLVGEQQVLTTPQWGPLEETPVAV